MKVLVAMSGGVDSSVAAATLKEEGYQVIGATMQIWPLDEQADCADRLGSGTGTGAIEDAKKVASKLAIPHYVLNLRNIFRQKVITEFCREYSLGRTPNPCISCNKHIKFGVLLEKAGELGADIIATGHYARIEKNSDNSRYLLKKGVDQRKEQSYWLYSLNQEQLRHSMLPIGNLTKERVREIAGELQLPVSARPESQEICFIPDNDYPKFLKERIPEAAKPGPILDKEGTILGEHKGILFYTIGQRRGLGISAREPRYVIAVSLEKNAIMVGSRQELYGSELVAFRLNWIAIDKPRQPLTVSAKIRYLHQEAEAVVTPVDEDRVRVKFHQPQLAITPGQAIVFYHGDTVVGGGVIERTINR